MCFTMLNIISELDVLANIILYSSLIKYDIVHTKTNQNRKHVNYI